MTLRAQFPTRRFFDFSVAEDGLVATAELKKSAGGLISYWWTSGLNSENRLILLSELQLSLPDSDWNEERLATVVYRPFVEPLARIGSGVSGIVQLTPLFKPEFRPPLLTEHLFKHRELGTYSDSGDGLVGCLAKQYQLAESFGISTSIEFLATWNEVPVSTIRKRLERARLDGLVEKKRASENESER